MEVTFKRTTVLGGSCYPVGCHSLTDSLRGDWYLMAMVADGDAIIHHAPVEIPVDASPEPKKRGPKPK